MRNRWISGDLQGVVNNHLIDYPTPANLSYGWGLGSLAGISLVVQIVTGVFLAMHYVGNLDLAFDSVEHIMRDVNNGWLLRYLHANGASMFFIVVYIHIFRGIYYGSYMRPRLALWFSGVLIFFLMIMTAFIGYVLPYGQMSLWGATVITNLLSSIPFVGEDIVCWLWGGFSIDNATLNRFYSFHYLLPFIIAGLALLHLVLLHSDGSSNRLGIETEVDKIGFYPYCYVKDLLMFMIMLLSLSYLVYWNPNVLGHSDNYIPADSLSTPDHIVPEWYFLSFYAILRAVPHKLGGVLLMLLAILVLFVLPFISKGEIRSNAFRPLMRKVFWLFVGTCVLLIWLGQKLAIEPYVSLGQVMTVIYFMLILLVIPGVNLIETFLLRRGN